MATRLESVFLNGTVGAAKITTGEGERVGSCLGGPRCQ